MKWIQWNLLFIFFSSLFYFHNFTTIFFWFPFSTIGFFLSRVENDTEANRQAYGKASFVLPSISICWRKRTLKLRWIFVYIRCCFYWYGTRNAWYVEKEGNENLKTKTKWPILHVALIWKIRNFKTFFFLLELYYSHRYPVYRLCGFEPIDHCRLTQYTIAMVSLLLHFIYFFITSAICRSKLILILRWTELLRKHTFFLYIIQTRCSLFFLHSDV